MTRRLSFATSMALILAMTAGASWAKSEAADYTRNGFHVSALGLVGIPTYDGALDGTFEAAFPAAGSVDVGISGGFSIRAGYRLHPRFSTELGFEWIAPYKVEVGGDEVSEVSTWMFFVDTRIHVMTGRVQPFLLIGMGAYHLDFSLPPSATGAIDATDFAPRLGGGLDYYFTQSIALTSEVVYVIGTRRLFELDYVGISLGLTYRF